MQTWLDKLCEPLEHPKYPQIKGKLVVYDEDNNIIGKCAEGEIACQNNITTGKEQGILYFDQLKQLGIPEDLVTNILPYIGGDKGEEFIDWFDDDDIGNYIWKLNDNGFTYRQIVSFLRTTFEDAV